MLNEYYEKLQENIIKTAWHNCEYMQKMALIPKGSKTKVGACILGRKNTSQKFFMGCNIVISTSHVYHAEIVALLSCLSENYKPVEVFVTSRSIEENIHCCLDCRARLLESNPEITYTVFNPDGTVKAHDMIQEDCKFIMEDKSGKIDWNNIITKNDKREDN
ncbi:cytidine deaminase zinc-binding domain protein [Nitrososphaeria virus YSH_462411]|uniref:Cytidine deaminase zinc-binding domain protein n=1 Tax=Nitrososphaeria virus YSH_462411 TaxID=3071321 RepID=A0A976YF38_9CAUD|nr:cytidine deaminase zinc-binding domain protein [Yangshan Harbor Nitrososphaeria virus]UVF62334.1 cytidine deaminase zinc-binding domain protein [Nitrososphaeria virus YSH_462411]